MASQIARELAITYNGFTVGGTETDRILRDLHKLEESNEQATIEYRFTIKKSTKAAFVTECAAAETAFRAVHKDTTVVIDGTTLKSYLHATSTGFNSKATIIKAGEPTDSARSRTYTIRVEVGLPGTGTGNRRLLRTSINVSYSPARRRTVTISCEYTANGSTSARAQYESAIDAFTSSVLTDLAGTYKLAEQPTTDYDDANKVVRVTQIFEEIIYTRIGASNADLRREVVIISRSKVGPGDTPVTNRLVTLNVQYQCWFDKTQEVDLHGQWTILLPQIMAQVKLTLGGNAVALVNEDPQFDYTDNRIQATLTCMGSTSGGIIENRITTTVDIESGEVRTPIWHKGPFDRYIYQGPATDRKTVTVVQKTLRGGSSLGGGGGIGGSPTNGRPGTPGVLEVGIGAGGVGLGLQHSIGGLNVFGGPQTGDQISALVQAIMGNAPAGGGGGASGGGGAGSYRFVSSHKSSTPTQIGVGVYVLPIEETTVVTVFERASQVS